MLEFVAFIGPAILAQGAFFALAWTWRRRRPESWERLQTWLHSRTQIQAGFLQGPPWLATGLLLTFGASFASWIVGKPDKTIHLTWVIWGAGMAVFMPFIHALNNKKASEPEDWLLWDLEGRGKRTTASSEDTK